MLIRIFKDWADFLYLNLIYTKECGHGLNDIINYYRKGDTPRSGSAEDRDRAYRAYKRLGGIGGALSTNARLEDLIEALGRQLSKTQEGSYSDGALLDEVAKLVCTSFGRNAIDGRTLNRLRQVLLLPEELAELRADLHRHELHCVHCRRPLQDGEMVTLCVTEGANHDVSIACTNCRVPEYVPCKCGEILDTTKGVINALRKNTTCPTCAGKPKPVQPEVAAATPEPANRAPYALYQQLGDVRRRRTATIRVPTLNTTATTNIWIDEGTQRQPQDPEGGQGNGG